jgi:hypothetical protein
VGTDTTAARVLGPYFRSCEQRTVVCDWLPRGATLSIRFKDKATRVAFQERTCCRWQYRELCEIAGKMEQVEGGNGRG